MRLSKIRIKNFRSIADSGEIRIEPLQALVGENNSGKSNILKAISCFLSPGAGGMALADFKDLTEEASIECEFNGLTEDESNRLRSYLFGEKIVLTKFLRIEKDEDKGKSSVKAEFHGYQAEPRDVALSMSKIESQYGPRPKWAEIAASFGILEHVQDDRGKVNKTTYKKGLERYLRENIVEYDEPVLGDTQALGLPQNLLANLPRFYLLPAITDYSDEVDRRSTSTVFRRLMSDLADRVMRADPRYAEIDQALAKIRSLLNRDENQEKPTRLDALTTVENSLAEIVRQLMPSVESVALDVEVEASEELFSKGVNIRIDDGVLTDVVDKGHGMQRSLVFSLLQMLIDSLRTQAEGRNTPPIILAIEEPELYIHPHSQRLIFRVLKEFAGMADDEDPSGSDQVIYTTHSASFVEVWKYERIGLVRKPDLATGTTVKQAAPGVLDGPDERKTEVAPVI